MHTSPASSALSRRTALTALAGAGAATLLGAGTASARPSPAAATVCATAFPSAETERLRLATVYRGSDFITTAHYAPAGTAITVHVKATDGVLPTLHIGLYDNYHDVVAQRAPRAYTLTSGSNTITDPYGGPVYLRLPGDGEQARVTFTAGAVNLPTFALGRTTESQFQELVDSSTTSAYVELTSPHAIITVSRNSFLTYRNEDHGRLMNLVESLIASHAAVSGLDGSSALHSRRAGPYHFNEVTKVPTGVGAYATHYFNAFPASYLDRLITVEGVSNRGWGFYHELGHLHQQFAYRPSGLTEVSVNIYSLAVQRLFGQTSNLLTVNATTGLNWFQTALPKLGTAGLSFATSFGAYEKLVSLRQLELAFGTDIWPRLHKLIREENPQSDWQTQDALRWTNFATYTSRITGYDLTDFYVDKWAYPVDADGRAALAALNLPTPPVDPSTLTD